MKEEDMYCECYACNKRLDLGDSIQYTTSGYDTYCDNKNVLRE